MMRGNGKLLLASVSALALSASAAFAQTAVNDRGTQLEELVVTAQKREQALNDIGISIVALSSDQLQERQVRSAADLARVVPGFSYADTGVNAPVYSLRGVGYFDYSLSAAPAVTVYLDEVPLAYPAMTQGATFDLKRVEVLKGPQGTLFGQNSTGGLVNYIAQEPTKTPEGGFAATYGRFNRLDLEGYLSGPLSDAVRARLALTSTTSDDWQHSITRDDTLGAMNKQAGRLIVDWDVASNVTATFNLNGYLDKSDPLATQLIAVTPLTPARLLPIVANAPKPGDDPRAADWDATPRPFRDDQFWQASVRLQAGLPHDLKLTSITAYSNLDSKGLIDRDGMANRNSTYGINAFIHSFYQELRLQGETPRLSWIAGATYGKDETNEVSPNFIDTSSNVQNQFGVQFSRGDSRIHNDVKAYAAYASGDWTLSDQLTLTTGVRYTKTDRTFVGCANPTEPAAIEAFSRISAFFRNARGLPPVPFAPFKGCLVLGADFLATEPTNTLKEDNVSWRLALNYKPTEDLLLYASATKGYKGGNGISVAGSAVRSYQPVTQESVMSYETGFKATLLERSMQLNGAIFYYDYEDKQTRSKIVDPVFGPVQALVNIPKSHAYGAELELQWAPAEGLTVNGGAAYLKTEIDNWTGFDALGVQRDFAGHPFSFAPEWQLNLDVDKRWSLTAALDGYVGASAAYRSRASSDFDSYPLFDIDAYTLVDLRAGVETTDGKWRFSAFANNVTDQYYWYSTVRIQDTVVRYPGMPRTYGVGVSARF